MRKPFEFHYPTNMAFVALLLFSSFVIRCGSVATAAEPEFSDAEWLQPPKVIPQPERPLREILKKDDGTAIESPEQWRKMRREIRQAWQGFLGPLPQPADDLHIEVTNQETLEKCIRTRIRYAAEPGRVVEAFVLRPREKSTKRLPGAVVFHSTTTATMNAVAGTGGRPEQHIGLRLAERGFVVVCPSNYLWEETSYLKSVAAAKERHPDSLGMATMLADGMRAVDVLLAQPDVDSQRIGTMGHSLGAKEVLYLLAFDPRVKAGVASEGGVGIPLSNWDAPWYLGEGVNAADFPRGHHELVALIAPKPFLVLAGESGRGSADGARSWPYLLPGQEVCRIVDQPVRIGLYNHQQGHQLSPEMAERAFRWLENALSE